MYIGWKINIFHRSIIIQLFTMNIYIHCQPSMLQTIKESGLNWCYSPQFNQEEIDVIIPYTSEVEAINDKYLDESEFVSHFGLDYNQVNCIQLI